MHTLPEVLSRHRDPPLSGRLSDLLKSEIVAEPAPDDQLPAEAALAARSQARRAERFAELARRGLSHTVQGQGSFAAAMRATGRRVEARPVRTLRDPDEVVRHGYRADRLPLSVELR